MYWESATRDKPPPGSRDIDKTSWSGDHPSIKKGIGADPDDKVKIDQDGHVWGQNPDGTWTDHGPAANFTGSGKASGRRGIDREKNKKGGKYDRDNDE